MSEFVKGWDIVQVLGEGAYGEVQLLVNRVTHQAVAVKVIDLRKHEEAEANVKKEVCVHRMLNDPHIIKYFGHRKDGNMQSIFLEYASHGELFDRIEPDVGMPMEEAHRFFCQLISGVKYLHDNGIAHRDLKPENLLLDEHDNLKISDFGMATVFRFQGVERKLRNRCGTVPYVAPEVLITDYAAQPVDIWSCGIILVALLAGELPWDKPTLDCPEYRDWKSGRITNSPWCKINTLVLSLLKRILMPAISRRYSMEQISSHKWFRKSNRLKNSALNRSSDGSTPIKRFCSRILDSSGSIDELSHRYSASQPLPHGNDVNEDDDAPVSNFANHVIVEGAWFSQPAQPDNMVLSSQLQSQCNSSQGPIQKLVKRLTRFFVKISAQKTVTELKYLYDKLGYSWKIHSPGQITVTTQDRRKSQLIFKTNIIEMNDRILVDFRLSRGDGLEFKRKFIQIQDKLSDLIVKGPLTWPIAMATNCIP